MQKWINLILSLYIDFQFFCLCIISSFVLLPVACFCVIRRALIYNWIIGGKKCELYRGYLNLLIKLRLLDCVPSWRRRLHEKFRAPSPWSGSCHRLSVMVCRSTIYVVASYSYSPMINIIVDSFLRWVIVARRTQSRDEPVASLIGVWNNLWRIRSAIKKGNSLNTFNDTSR